MAKMGRRATECAPYRSASFRAGVFRRRDTKEIARVFGMELHPPACAGRDADGAARRPYPGKDAVAPGLEVGEGADGAARRPYPGRDAVAPGLEVGEDADGAARRPYLAGTQPGMAKMGRRAAECA